MIRVDRKRFEDGEKIKASGKYEYAGYLYHMVFEDMVYVVRQYDDAPEEASFLRALDVAGQDVLGSGIPYDDPRFRESVSYLISKLGVKRPTVLLIPGGYEAVDLRRLDA